MRDLIVVAIVIGLALAALRAPWIGMMLWTWLSIMNPHRFTWGFAYDAPLAAIAAGATFLGLLITKDERASPFKGPPAVVLAVLMAWMTLSWIFGLDPAGDYEQWKKVMKVDLMVLVGLMVLHTKKHIFALAWVAVGSLALLGMKGGLFTILTGGGHHVFGPPETFIEDNNEFAVALIMTIPLLRFLQMQLRNRWARMALTAAMLMCGAAALGSQSRGALLGISAMLLMLWWRGRSLVLGGALIAITAVALVAFMPDTWSTRMATIETYGDDRSAMSRISAWWNAWNLAFHYPLGVGFNAARPELFAQYSPYPDLVQGAHSIYFLILGNHGFIGLLIYLVLGVVTWASAGWLRVSGAKRAETQWCSDLGGMVQVSLIGFAVGGAFLSLSYFDLPYIMMSLVVLARVWVQTQGWLREPAEKPGWFKIPGLAQIAPKAAHKTTLSRP